ncbi:MAG: hypothetical protein Q9O62_03560 [Ardenticatenia bacterium]|nr:hypothetical protein [Ardenticatenia bacterium]
MARMPGWLQDALLAALMVVVAVVVERWTQGRVANSTIVVWVGGLYFVLLRLGAWLARMGRTLGCLFGFGVTWLLPCGAVAYVALSGDRVATVRDSLPLFILLGVFLVVVMTITLARVRAHDMSRRPSTPAEGAP